MTARYSIAFVDSGQRDFQDFGRTFDSSSAAEDAIISTLVEQEMRHLEDDKHVLTAAFSVSAFSTDMNAYRALMENTLRRLFKPTVGLTSLQWRTRTYYIIPPT